MFLWFETFMEEGHFPFLFSFFNKKLSYKIYFLESWKVKHIIISNNLFLGEFLLIVSICIIVLELSDNYKIIMW